MVNRKVTPEISKFIQSNCKLTPNALSGLISKKFNIDITEQALRPHVERARSDAEADNNAKVEAVRSKILDDADKWANKYLQYTDDEIESLRKLIKASEEGDKPVALETARDRLAASTALHKMLSTIIDFVKPEEKANVIVNVPITLQERQKKYEEYFEKLENDSKGKGNFSGDSPG